MVHNVALTIIRGVSLSYLENFVIRVTITSCSLVRSTQQNYLFKIRKRVWFGLKYIQLQKFSYVITPIARINLTMYVSANEQYVDTLHFFCNSFAFLLVQGLGTKSTCLRFGKNRKKCFGLKYLLAFLPRSPETSTTTRFSGSSGFTLANLETQARRLASQ